MVVVVVVVCMMDCGGLDLCARCLMNMMTTKVAFMHPQSTWTVTKTHDTSDGRNMRTFAECLKCTYWAKFQPCQ